MHFDLIEDKRSSAPRRQPRKRRD